MNRGREDRRARYFVRCVGASRTLPAPVSPSIALRLTAPENLGTTDAGLKLVDGTLIDNGLLRRVPATTKRSAAQAKPAAAALRARSIQSCTRWNLRDSRPAGFAAHVHGAVTPKHRLAGHRNPARINFAEFVPAIGCGASWRGCLMSGKRDSGHAARRSFRQLFAHIWRAAWSCCGPPVLWELNWLVLLFQSSQFSTSFRGAIKARN